MNPFTHSHVLFLMTFAAASLGVTSAAQAAPKAIVVLGEPEIAYSAPQPPAATEAAKRAPEAKPQAPRSADATRSPETIKERQPQPAPTKRWVCGAWEELWQGHGQGRSCEWR